MLFQNFPYVSGQAEWVLRVVLWSLFGSNIHVRVTLRDPGLLDPGRDPGSVPLDISRKADESQFVIIVKNIFIFNFIINITISNILRKL